MANPTNQKKVLHSGRHASAIKRARQAVAQRADNRSRKQVLRKAVKAVREAVAAHDAAAAGAALQQAVPLLDRTGRKGIIPKTRAARLVSRLTRAVQGL